MRDHRPTNPEMLNTISYLKRAGRQHQAPLWLTVASFLGKSRRTRIVLNLGQVSRLAKAGDVIVVPGKVLGSGIPKEKHMIAQNGRRPHTAKVVGSNPSRPTTKSSEPARKRMVEWPR